jgi:hypothetical protein
VVCWAYASNKPFILFFLFYGLTASLLISIIVSTGVYNKMLVATLKEEATTPELATDRLPEGIHVSATVVLGHQRLGADADDACIHGKLLAVRARILAVPVGRGTDEESATRGLLCVDAHLVARAPEDVVVDVIPKNVTEVTDVILPSRKSRVDLVALNERPVRELGLGLNRSRRCRLRHNGSRSWCRSHSTLRSITEAEDNLGLCELCPVLLPVHLIRELLLHGVDLEKTTGLDLDGSGDAVVVDVKTHGRSHFDSEETKGM